LPRHTDDSIRRAGWVDLNRAFDINQVTFAVDGDHTDTLLEVPEPSSYVEIPPTEALSEPSLAESLETWYRPPWQQHLQQ
jgi:hypothetical protein